MDPFIINERDLDSIKSCTRGARSLLFRRWPGTRAALRQKICFERDGKADLGRFSGGTLAIDHGETAQGRAKKRISAENLFVSLDSLSATPLCSCTAARGANAPSTIASWR